MHKPRTGFRVVTSVVMVLGFSILAVSGIVLYMSPQGRVANWTDWRLLGLRKEEWAAVHTLTALVFLVAGLFHVLLFNRTAVWAYLKRSFRNEAPFRWAVTAAGIAVAVVLAGTVAGVAPFATVMDAGQSIKDSWAGASGNPPVPHMEDMRLSAVAAQAGVTPDAALRALAASGIAVLGDDPLLRTVAAGAGKSPAEVFALLRPASSPPAPPSGHVPGTGRRTVTQIAGDAGVEVSVALGRLAARGIAARGSDTMRELADGAGMTPAEVAAVIRGDGLD
ncbi:MAG: DUF4405 domain-containing protein [Acidobacteriota bacterium]